jgi:hypothetical protein
MNYALLSTVALAATLLPLSTLALAQPENVTTTTVKPEAPTAQSPAPQLTEAERERLISMTMVVLEDLLSASRVEPAPDAPDGKATEASAVKDPVGTLESLLRQTTRDNSQTLSEKLLRFLDVSDAHLRITALRWLSARPDIAAVALTKGLRDGNDMVRTASSQILFEHGATDEEIARVTTDTGDEPESSVLLVVTRVLGRQDNSATDR